MAILAVLARLAGKLAARPGNIEFDRMEEILSIDRGDCYKYPRDVAFKTYITEFPG